MRFAERRGWVFAAITPIVMALAGCGGGLPEASDATQAGPVVTTALDAWKRGDKPDSLLGASSPIRVIDHEWQTGWTLRDYRLEGTSVSYGLSIRQPVTLELKSPQGQEVDKSVFYVVDTGKTAVLTREDLDGE
jgi:hypothetical protein